MARNGLKLGPPTNVGTTAKLDAAIAPLAAELHRSTLYRALLAGTVKPPAYIGLLQSLLTIHRSLERAIVEARHLTAFKSAPYRREEALLRDLRLLHAYQPVRSNRTLDEIESRAQSWIRPPCEALLGAFYAVESERRQSLKLARPLAKALDLKVAPRQGLDYHLEGSERAARRFGELKEWLDSSVGNAVRVSDLVDGATRTLHALIALHEGPALPI